MMNVMHGPGTGFGFALFGLVHLLSSLAFLVGALLLFTWAYKHMPEKQMKFWMKSGKNVAIRKVHSNKRLKICISAARSAQPIRDHRS